IAATIAALWLSAVAEVRAPDDLSHPAALPNPVLWFKLDEGSGTQVSDGRETRQGGKLVGDLPPRWVEKGIAGSALRFDPASTGYVLAPDDESFGRFQQLTVSVWVKAAPGAS